MSVCTKPKENKTLITNIILTSIPAALAGFLLSDFLESETRVLPVVITTLSIIGLLMIFADKLYRNPSKNQISNIKKPDAIAVGLAQMFALIPGTSRSGITILAAKQRGFSNAVAAEYSFLAGIPVIAGAALKTALEPEAQEVFRQDTFEIAIGVIVAFVAGYAVLNFLISYISKNGIALFGYYRLALAALLFILWVNQ
jgi:undecaprenyl-diphosphatase